MSAPKHQSHIARRYSTGGHPTLATAPCKASWGGVGGSGALSPLFSPGWAQSSCPASPVGPGSTGTELPDELGGGGVKAHRGVCGPRIAAARGSPWFPGHTASQAWLRAGQRRQSTSRGCTLSPAGEAGSSTARGEPGNSKMGSTACASIPKARSYPRQHPCPPGPLARFPRSCFPATPSRYEQPGFPLREISCFPDCRITGFSWMSSLPPARRPAHRVRSACHAASMSE